MAVGTLGIILPVLPATPFLLLALFYFTRGSEKIAAWFAGTNLYKKHLKKYADNKGLPMKEKIFIQLLASLMMVISFFFIKYWLFRALLFVLFLIHNYVFIFRIKTLPKE